MPWHGTLPVRHRLLRRTRPRQSRRCRHRRHQHALLAIDAVADSAVLPEHQLLVVDEAHDLADRVTAVATGELTSTTLGVASRRITRLVEPELMQRWERASANFTMAIQNATAGRIDHLDDELATHLTALRDAA